MKIESIKLKNFKAFKDTEMLDIPHFCVLVGANGSGKSTLFQVFAFLKEALVSNVHTALIKLGGSMGFKEVRSRNSSGNIEIEVKFREKNDKPLITYFLSIGEKNDYPFVEREILKYRRGSSGQPWHFLNFSKGKGTAVTNELDEVTDVNQLNREKQKLKAKTTEEGRVLLRFKDGAFEDPFLARYVSDGTIKMFAYLLLLYDPNPHPLLCVEEPENQLYPKLLWELAEEFRTYATRGGQVFVSTHSPDFLNAVELDEVFWLVKEYGYAKIKRARDDEQIKAFMEAGDKMGYLWKQGFFEGIDPLCIGEDCYP
jgi:predicted ATPase